MLRGLGRFFQKMLSACAPVAPPLWVAAAVALAALWLPGQAWAADLNPLRDAHLTWWDSMKYWYYYIEHNYSDYATVVRISYLMSVLSALSIIGVLLGLLNIFRHRRRGLRYRRRMEKRYASGIEEVLTAPQELTDKQAAEKIKWDYEGKFKKWQYHEWMGLISDIYAEVREGRSYAAKAGKDHKGEEPQDGADAADHYDPSGNRFRSDYEETQSETARTHCLYHNIRSLMKGTGLQQFMDNGLLDGMSDDRIFMVQVSQQFHLKMAESVLVRMYNSRKEDLRHVARAYHMFASRDEPYRFLSEEEQRAAYALGDWLWIHHVLGVRRASGKDVPSLVPMLENVKDDSFRSFLILEVGYWGSASDMEHLRGYFTSRSESNRMAAFMAMGQYGYIEAEREMMAAFPHQSDKIQQIIIMSVFTLATGEAGDFFEEVFHSLSSGQTKRVALRCLWHYGMEAKKRFLELKETVNDHDRQVFEQIERTVAPPILYNDGHIQ